MSLSEQKLQEFRDAMARAKDLVIELVESHPEALKDSVIRYQLWRLRQQLAGLDLEWTSEPER